MTIKIKKTTKKLIGQIALASLFVAAVTGLAFAGSSAKRDGSSNNPLIIASGSDTYDVSVDELSELFIMSNVAEDSQLSSSSTILSSFYSARVQYTTNQYSLASDKIEKPVITDVTGVSKGVIQYVVEQGDTINSIIAKNSITGLTVDQVRWSNGLKTANISAGNTLYLPAVAGIVYVVRSGDTPSNLASRYKSNAASICSANYLGENCKLKEGMRIVLPGGILPTTERPEYVPPRRPTLTLRYTSDNLYAPGWCTWYAWQYRHQIGGEYELPSTLKNAKYWAVNAAPAYVVDTTPRVNAVFVSTAGKYGHVGIVTKVNGDTIDISEMNGRCGRYCVNTRTVERSEWSRWRFIHQKK